jgi:hypothetical protein
MASLIETQRGFAAAVRSHAGQRAALPLLSGDAARNEELLAVYRGNAVANAGKALSLNYPVIERIVGAEFFGGLCRAFWEMSPSQSGDLNEYGGDFAEFLASFPHVASMPYLPDVARVEWLVSCCTRAADHSAVSIAALAEIAPESVGDLRFGLQPALVLLSSRWPVASIWQQHQSHYVGEINIDMNNAECIVVHRVGLRVDVASVSAGEGALWRAALDGKPLGEMLEAAFMADEPFDAQAALQAGFSREFVTSLRVA